MNASGVVRREHSEILPSFCPFSLCFRLGGGEQGGSLASKIHGYLCQSKVCTVLFCILYRDRCLAICRKSGIGKIMTN